MRFLIIESRPFSGFFTNFFHTCQHLRRADVKGYIPIVHWHGGIYAKSPESKENVWEYYFEPVSDYSIDDVDSDQYEIKVTSKYLKTSLPRDPPKCWDWKHLPPHDCLFLPSNACRRHVKKDVIDKHIRVRQHIQDKIDNFYAKYMQGFDLLAVHFRATKDAGMQLKQGKKPFDRFCKVIDQFLHTHDKSRVFVATDLAKSLDEFKKRFGSAIIHYDAIRSKTGWPVQYGDAPESQGKTIGPQGGEECLIDCILLSKCDEMVYGVSNLSACAPYFNPQLKLHYRGKRAK